MSTADIADNKWEVEASKPPIRTFSGILQIAVVASFAGLFVWMLSFTLAGIFGYKRETMAEQYGRLTVDGSRPQTEPPAGP